MMLYLTIFHNIAEALNLCLTVLLWLNRIVTFLISHKKNTFKNKKYINFTNVSLKPRV